jgi:hypothetical protein
MKVLRYAEYNAVDMAQDFLNVIGNNRVDESGNNDSIVKKIMQDLKLNYSLVLTFGVGLQAMFPIVNKLISNMNLNIDLTPETIVLMTIAGITIAYLEEHKELEERKKLEKDAKSMLEELKLRGVGNGIVKKLVACIKSMGNIFKILFKNRRHIINGFFDMFGYTSIVIPVLNAISYMIGKYDMNLETLPSNFLSLGLGVTTLAAKHGLNYLIDLLKDKLKISKNDIFKHVNDVDDPILKKYPHPEYIDVDYDNIENDKLIKEHD